MFINSKNIRKPNISKARNSVLLADEAQNTLRLEIDYVITHGGRQTLGQMGEQGRLRIGIFTDVLEGATLKGIRESIKANGWEKATRDAGIRREGEVGKITNEALQASAYKYLLDGAMRDV